MTALLKRYATPFITTLFVISLVTGIALFFHTGPQGFRAMHEWLSLVLILPFVLHLWRNWRPMTGYLRDAPMAVATVASLAMAAPFLMAPSGGPGGGRGGPPQMALMQKVLAHPVAELAPVLDLSPEALTQRLTKAGVALTDPAQPVAEAITASGVQPGAVMAVLAGG